VAAAEDPGLGTELNNLLEELSHYVNFTALEQEDGSTSVFIGGNRLLVIADQTYRASVGFDPGGARTILDHDAQDITRYLTGGKLGSLLESYNRTLEDLQTDLDNLAASVADEVNFTLQGGVDLDGVAPAQGLFSYDAVTGAANSLRRTDLTPRQLALALPAQPGGNSNALNLVETGRRRQANGESFAESLGALGGRVGRLLENARNGARTGEALLAQAKAQRQEESGVSLDEEAAALIEYQRSYQAAAQLFRTLNEMTQAVIEMSR
jgi:flagellar hook-associated protein 1 FlgK